MTVAVAVAALCRLPLVLLAADTPQRRGLAAALGASSSSQARRILDDHASSNSNDLRTVRRCRRVTTTSVATRQLPRRKRQLCCLPRDDGDGDSRGDGRSDDPTSSSSFSLFDFASAPAWEAHYAAATRRRGATPVVDREEGEGAAAAAAAAAAASASGGIEEWHGEIPLELLVELVGQMLCRPGAAVMDDTTSITKTILVVGCGTSHLPTLLLEKLSMPVRLVLLDSSRTCMEQVSERYRPSVCGGGAGAIESSPSSQTATTSTVECWCGNVLKAPSTWERVMSHHRFPQDDDEKTSSLSTLPPTTFDVIVDKGLMDVLLCGDDWDTTVARLLYLANDSFSLVHGDGHDYYYYYVLVSYTLPPSTRQFLVDQGAATNWEWSFDVGGSRCDDAAFPAGGAAAPSGSSGGRGRSMISVGRKMAVELPPR